MLKTLLVCGTILGSLLIIGAFPSVGTVIVAVAIVALFLIFKD